MSYYILGSNYELANTDFSSKISFDSEKKKLLTNQLLNNNLVDTCLIVSTCNRSEVFVYKKNVKNLGAWCESIRQIVFRLHNLDSTEDFKFFYQKVNQEACFHLFKVACGLDSLVLGEPQIIGQIKDAMSFTENYFKEHDLKIPTEFTKLINETYACSKEVRTRTSIGKYAVSIAYMACKIARNLFSNFENQSILLIGASQTNMLLARHLIRNGITNFKVINRTLKNAQNFVNELNCGSAYTMEELPELLKHSSLVFSSTSSNNFIISRELLSSILENSTRKILLFDLAIPNDIDPNVRELEQVALYNRDDLQNLVSINKQKRVDAIQDSLPIIYKYLKSYQEQNRILQGNEIIVEYRNSVHQHRVNLVNEAKQAIQRGEDPSTIIENLSLSLTNKILHTPTLMLSSFIKNGQTCQLNEIHTYLDRDDKEFMQTVIDNTLNKEIFKNTCCQDNGKGLFNCKSDFQLQLLQISEPSSIKNSLDSVHNKSKNDLSDCLLLDKSSKEDQDLNFITSVALHTPQIQDNNVNKCPFHTNTEFIEQFKQKQSNQNQQTNLLSTISNNCSNESNANFDESLDSFTFNLVHKDNNASYSTDFINKSNYDQDAENLDNIVNSTTKKLDTKTQHVSKQDLSLSTSPLFNLIALEEQSGFYVPFEQIEQDNNFFNELNAAIHSEQTVYLNEDAVMINCDLDSGDKVGLVHFNRKQNDQK